jgi:drug/metabolite transporter (DMT)-like permease
MNRTGKGIALALVTALISGVAIFVNSYAVRELADAALFTTLKNGVAALALLGVTVLAARRPRSLPAGARTLTGITAVGVFGGGLAFLLFFSGLAMASAPSAAFIHKTLFIWVALLAMPLLGERAGIIQVGALGVLLAGQVLVAPPVGIGWGPGETMIAAATLLWAAEVILAKRLLVGVSPPLLGAARMGLGLVVLIGYLAVTGRLGGLGSLDGEALLWVLVTGAMLAGYVTTWFHALRLAPATTVTSILVVGAVGTGLLSSLASGTAPDPRVVLGYLLIVGAVAFVAITASRPRSDRVHVHADG